ncbi:nitrogen fixation protein NifZ [Trinickia sp. EG282A]|uniref:nitrogen fixation protein NifZ n=1 Tax=Trinickia sp. EG282A TaxID=3237013 RepID=UPI0034D29DF1
MSIEFIQPEYSLGMRVIALDDLCNDGSYPDWGEGGRLVTAGALGEIVNVGRVIETGEPVYLVDFGGQVIGCTEDEIAPAPAGLLPEEPCRRA